MDYRFLNTNTGDHHRRGRGGRLPGVVRLRLLIPIDVLEACGIDYLVWDQDDL